MARGLGKVGNEDQPLFLIIFKVHKLNGELGLEISQDVHSGSFLESQSKSCRDLVFPITAYPVNSALCLESIPVPRRYPPAFVRII